MPPEREAFSGAACAALTGISIIRDTLVWAGSDDKGGICVNGAALQPA
jgi:hypothetical protein